MHWYTMLLILWFVFSPVVHIAVIGRSTTFTSGGAICSLIISGLAIWAIVATAAH